MRQVVRGHPWRPRPRQQSVSLPPPISAGACSHRYRLRDWLRRQAAQSKEPATRVTVDLDHVSIARCRRRIGHHLPVLHSKAIIEFDYERLPGYGPVELERGRIAECLNGQRRRSLRNAKPVGVPENVKDPRPGTQRPELPVNSFDREKNEWADIISGRR